MNLQKEVYELAVKKEEEMQALSVLFNEALPSFEEHIRVTTEEFKYIIKN